MRDEDPTAQPDQPEETLHLAALQKLIDQSDLKPHLKRTLTVLVRFGHWKTGTRIRPALDEAAWELNKSRRQVNRDINALLEFGALATVGPVGPVRRKNTVEMTARRGGRDRPTEYRLDLERLRARARSRPEARPETLTSRAETLTSRARNLDVDVNRSSGSNRSGEERAAAAPQLELVPELDPDDHTAVITAVVTKDILPQRLPDAQLLAATMTRCEELHIPCTPDVAGKAVDSALWRYYRALRLEFDLPADPRRIYHDHEAPKAMGLPTPMLVKRRPKRRSRDNGNARAP